MSPRFLRAASLALMGVIGGVVGAGLAGCGGERGFADRVGADAAPVVAAAPSPAATVIGKDDGLEVRWWITESSGDALLGALGSELTNPVPLDDRTREILAANGFRVISVPVEMVDRLPTRLRPVGSVQQQRLAQTGVWTDVARGPLWKRPALLTMHDGPLELPAGRLRLLARGWLTPMPAGEGGGAGGAIESAVSFELVPQHEDRLGETQREVADLTLEEPDTTALGQGIMFWRLALRGQLRPGQALVVLAEDPFKRWSEGEESVAAAAPEEAKAPGASVPLGRVIRGDEERPILAPPSETAEQPARSGPAVGPMAGPPSLAAPTIGEALMLSEPIGRSGKSAMRAIVVLVPRTPENFRLLGAGLSGAGDGR